MPTLWESRGVGVSQAAQLLQLLRLLGTLLPRRWDNSHRILQMWLRSLTYVKRLGIASVKHVFDTTGNTNDNIVNFLEDERYDGDSDDQDRHQYDGINHNHHCRAAATGSPLQTATTMTHSHRCGDSKNRHRHRPPTAPWGWGAQCALGGGGCRARYARQGESEGQSAHA